MTFMHRVKLETTKSIIISAIEDQLNYNGDNKCMGVRQPV